ncbi:DNA-3-methyladenine glycosylase 1-like [Amyelois transitella]|uniref:DNA-3-methyladenine glycosylase 1-like n=1 Tax=Amyelois transitella TaxID=680683 RepID=UPI0029901E62|nr:DNA-3-methyladenine glycosylase 1-like [Amyelois transitella]
MKVKEENFIRCGWVSQDPIYIKYHDEEWGKPERDKLRLFEMICLEGQQAGLSWITILKKRQSYRKLFFNFDPHKIINLTENDINNLMLNSEIVRHKGKINAIINNAKCYLKMESDEEDFSKFVWSFVNYNPILNHWKHAGDIPAESVKSHELSKALKKRGFKFVGAKTCYAFMQACGLVNDHLIYCLSRK